MCMCSHVHAFDAHRVCRRWSGLQAALKHLPNQEHSARVYLVLSAGHHHKPSETLRHALGEWVGE